MGGGGKPVVNVGASLLINMLVGAYVPDLVLGSGDPLNFNDVDRY